MTHSSTYAKLSPESRGSCFFTIIISEWRIFVVIMGRWSGSALGFVGAGMLWKDSYFARVYALSFEPSL
jgi:hypothetical protein